MMETVTILIQEEDDRLYDEDEFIPHTNEEINNIKTIVKVQSILDSINNKEPEEIYSSTQAIVFDASLPKMLPKTGASLR